METLDRTQASRLALARAGLLRPQLTGMPSRGAGAGRRARSAAYRVLGRFGYLQLDSVSVAGARSHGIVLLSRLRGFEPALAEQLLRPGEPLFEYWGHEASWLPLDLYPSLEFRRRDYQTHPWWGDVLGEHPEIARAVIERVRKEGPLRSADLHVESSRPGWWGWGPTRRVLSALWSCGELAVRRRVHFHREYDLAERVIPGSVRELQVGKTEALRTLLLRALSGHGWATTATLAATWRLRNMRHQIQQAIAELQEVGEIVPCRVHAAGGAKSGWIRTADLELADRLRRVRPRRDTGVLLSPFDPVLWDRERVSFLFGFQQVLEIYKPKVSRRYGYYCLPVLAGERLIARLDLKAERARGILRVQSAHFEADPAPSIDRAATQQALSRYAEALKLVPDAGGQGSILSMRR